MNQRAAYWNQGIAQVPTMTGAASLMDGSDIRAHATALGFTLPFTSVLDVGCGTGRLSQFVSERYYGCDIAADAVAYCQSKAITALVIAGASDLPVITPPPAWITCLSVFTHIPRAERRAYLKAFYFRYSPNLLVDIIPDDGSGDVAMWTADVPGFEADLVTAGWRVVAQHERPCPSGPTHRFYRCRRGRD